MDKSQIEFETRQVHRKLWHQRHALGLVDSDLIKILNPAVGAKVLGADFEVVEELGAIEQRGTRSMIAGVIDRSGNAPRIAIGARFTPAVRRFTGAHELGHLVLHPRLGVVMHRDRPVDGANASRPIDPVEREADYFAACYLMPRKSVVEQFVLRFGADHPFAFDDHAAFLMSPNDVESPLNGTQDDRAALLATDTRFSRGVYRSLADTFGVSIGAMAIRLKELELVD